MDNCTLEVLYKNGRYKVEMPVDVDRYSTIELVDDCLTVLKKQRNVTVPQHPIFLYKHPKSMKMIEIGCDRQLLNMFSLFHGQELIEIIVEDGQKDTELMSTFRRWLTDADERQMLDCQEIICPTSPPPQTQPSQGKSPQTEPSLVRPPLHNPTIHQPPQQQPQTHNKQPCQSIAENSDKKGKKMKARSYGI